MSHSDKQHERHAGPLPRASRTEPDEQSPAASDAGTASMPSGPDETRRAGAAPDYPAGAAGSQGGVGDLMADTVHSVGDVGSGAVDATHDVLRGAISATEDVGSGVVGGATHLTRDLVHGVRDIGGDVGLAVRDGATGVLNVIGDVGGAAVHTVRDLLVDVVSGVRDVAGAAMGRSRTELRQDLSASRPRAALPEGSRETEYAPQPQQASRGAAAPPQRAAQPEEHGQEYYDTEHGAEGEPLPPLTPFPTSRHH